jgi:hypothetical protein
MERHRARWPVLAGRPWVSRRLPRLGWAAAVIAAGVVGACRVPVEYQASVGRRVTFALAPAELPRVEALARELEALGGVHQIDVRAMATPETASATLQVWGSGIDDGLIRDVVEAAGFPEPEIEDVDAPVQTTLGMRLGHEWLHRPLGETDIEHARARILAELAAQGIPAEAAQVDVAMERGENGEARVRVEVRAERVDP